MLNAFAEVVLIWYVGRMVDFLAQGAPAQVWADHGTEILVVALIILLGLAMGFFLMAEHISPF